MDDKQNMLVADVKTTKLQPFFSSKNNPPSHPRVSSRVLIK